MQLFTKNGLLVILSCESILGIRDVDSNGAA